MSKKYKESLKDEIAHLSAVIEKKNISTEYFKKPMMGMGTSKIPFKPITTSNSISSAGYSKSKQNSKYSINNVNGHSSGSTNNNSKSKYKFLKPKSPTKGSNLPLNPSSTATTTRPQPKDNLNLVRKSTSTTTTTTIINKSNSKYKYKKTNSPSTTKCSAGSGNTSTTSLKLRTRYSINNNKLVRTNYQQYIKTCYSKSAKTPRKIKKSPYGSYSSGTKPKSRYYYKNKYSLAKFNTPKRTKSNSISKPKRRIVSKYSIVNKTITPKTPSLDNNYRYTCTPSSSGRIRSISNSSTTFSLQLRRKFPSISKSQNSTYQYFKSKYSPRKVHLKKEQRKSIKELIASSRRYFETKVGESNAEDEEQEKPIISMIVPRRLPLNPYINPEDVETEVDPDGEGQNKLSEADSNSNTTNDNKTGEAEIQPHEDQRRQRLLSKLSNFKNRFNQLNESESRSVDFIPFKKS